MTDKQIVVDDIDISECEHSRVNASLFNAKILVQCSAFFLENEDSCCECSDNPNCYYKQLKRKEQECWDLKSVRDMWISKCEQETKIKEFYQDSYDDLKRTLTEIRNVLDTYYDDDWRATREIEKILQKISEVISE